MFGRAKGSSEVVKRGSAFRPAGPEKIELFPSSHTVYPPLPLTERDEALVNGQRVLVNHMLSSETNTRVHFAKSQIGPDEEACLWKRLASEVGLCYYPAELMTDSKSTLFGVSKKSSKTQIKLSKSLAELESSEQKAPEEGADGGEQSPKSAEEESESGDESLGGDDYKVHMDFEDEGARDDYDDGDDGGGDYGGEF
jgi:hypothetical protein